MVITVIKQNGFGGLEFKFECNNNHKNSVYPNCYETESKKCYFYFSLNLLFCS